MIVDLQRFVSRERSHWEALEVELGRMERDPHRGLSLEEAARFHALHRRAASDLAKLASFPAEFELRRYLEGLVARAHAEVHETRRRGARFAPLRWAFVEFPRAVRRRRRALAVSVGSTLAGVLFGVLAMVVLPDAKSVVFPAQFGHLQQDPSERVRREESRAAGDGAQSKTAFAAMLMTHNTRVSIGAMALGLTWGLGTLVLLFYNGVILGAVCLDYVRAGESVFLAGWLLPHGSIEIPAILLGGQAGCALAGALFGGEGRDSLRARLRRLAPDLVTIIGGVAIMLVWAGLVEAYVSQDHEPAIPYSAKIAFGALELVGLCAFLAFAGRERGGRSALDSLRAVARRPRGRAS